MIRMQTVLCPVDFSDLSSRELELAIEVCRATGARLVLHHNEMTAGPGFSKAWEWSSVHRGGDGSHRNVEDRMRALMASIPQGIAAEASLTSGPIANTVLHLAEALAADLVVLGSHGWSTPDHASVSERIIDRSPCPVLTMREGGSAVESFRLHRGPSGESANVVVPTDLSSSAAAIVAYAVDLARALPLHLHLLHVLPAGSAHESTVEKKMATLVPEDLAGRADCHVVRGETTDQILEFTESITPAFVVMGEHARGFFRRLFTHDTAREILHRARFPVWFVPTEPHS